MTPHLLISLTAWLALVGCNASVATDDYRDWIERDPQAWRVTEEGPEHQAGSLAPIGGEVDSPSNVEGWVMLAMQRNAGLRAAEYRIARLSEGVTQAEVLDDPMFDIAPVGQMAQTAAGEVGLMTGVSQKLPYPGKRTVRGAIAEQEALAAVRELDAKRLEVAADVRRAYWSLVDAQRARAVIQRDRELIIQQREIVDARYREGAAEQQDVLRAGVEIAMLEQRLHDIEQRRRSASAMLNQLTDRAIDAAVVVDSDADATAIDLDLRLDSLLTRAADHPRLAVLREQAQRYRLQRELAHLDRYPDLTVGLSYNVVQSDGLSAVANGEDQWWLTFGINLPIWQNKRDAAEREALAGLLETSALIAEEQNGLAFRVRDALSRVQAQRAGIKLFEQQVLPEARQTLEAADISYREGLTEFDDLIQNTRRLTELDLMYQKLLTQLQQDLADLRLAIGQGNASDESSPIQPESGPAEHHAAASDRPVDCPGKTDCNCCAPDDRCRGRCACS